MLSSIHSFNRAIKMHGFRYIQTVTSIHAWSCINSCMYAFKKSKILTLLTSVHYLNVGNIFSSIFFLTFIYAVCRDHFLRHDQL